MTTQPMIGERERAIARSAAAKHVRNMVGLDHVAARIEAGEMDDHEGVQSYLDAILASLQSASLQSDGGEDLRRAWENDVCDAVCDAENRKTVASFTALWDKSRVAALTAPRLAHSDDTAKLVEAGKAVIEAMTRRAIHGRDHVPSMRAEQQARGLLAQALASVEASNG